MEEEKLNKEHIGCLDDRAENQKEYYTRVLLMEQPFYRIGMTYIEAEEELEYLNNHLNAFFEGSYQPLWKQSMNENSSL